MYHFRLWIDVSFQTMGVNIFQRYAMAHPIAMANRMQSSQDVKPEEQDDHKIDDDDKCDDVSCPKLKRCLLAQQSDDGGGLPKFKKQKHRPDDDKVSNDDNSDYDVACPKLKRWIAEGDAGCSPKFKKQKHHPDEDQVDDDDKSDDVAVNQVAAVQQSGSALAVTLARNVVL